jgi:HJR/Mrr/RecB family endonuclease
MLRKHQDSGKMKVLVSGNSRVCANTGAVQEVNTSKGHYKADEAMIITSSPSFTAQAKREAKLLRIKLIARGELEKLIEKFLTN